MRLFIFSLLAFCSALFAEESPGERAVTYGYSRGGRLGNNLISYLHGKWISEKYKLPLLYKKFEHSDQFVFHEMEKYQYDDLKKFYPTKISLKDMNEIKTLSPGCEVVVPYFRDDKPHKRVPPLNFESPWATHEFRQMACELIKPRFTLNTVIPPSDTLNVVIHVRTGGGYDTEDVKLKLLLKFPPLDFYSDALEILSSHFGHTKIYAFVMTDDKEPLNLIAYFKEKMPLRDNIEFDCRPKGGPDVNILDDFFSVPSFDCLIRGDSTFTIVAELLADFKMVIYPKEAHVEGKKVIVDEFEIIMNDSLERVCAG